MSDTRQSLAARFRDRHYTPAVARIGLGCALIGAVCLVELGSTSGADTSFIPGNGTAQAQAIALAPTTGGLSYAITLATSISDFQDMEAQSLSQTVDLGAIGTSLEAEGCSGGRPRSPRARHPSRCRRSRPAATRAGATTSRTTPRPAASAPGRVGLGDDPAVVGRADHHGERDRPRRALHHQRADEPVARLHRQRRHPHGHRHRDIGSLSLGNGLVVLGGLHWTAENQTGGASTSTATFSISALTIGGVALPTSTLDSESPQTVLNIVNTALAPVGINVVWPATTTLPDGTIEISPMQIGIDNNALGQEVVGANLGSVQAERTAVVNALLNANCDTADAILVGDIATGVAAGGGNMNVLLGGANAVTNDQAEVDPFGPAGAPPAPAVSTSLTGNTGNSGSVGGVGSIAGNSGAALPSTQVPRSRRRPATAAPPHRRPRAARAPRSRWARFKRRPTASAWARPGVGATGATSASRSVWA